MTDDPSASAREPSGDAPTLTLPVKGPGGAVVVLPLQRGAGSLAAEPYIFGAQIARGGMGSVLEAQDRKLERTVAVKVMLSEMTTDAVQRQRFVNEALVLGRLEHPNIVPVHDLGLDPQGQLYYTMKLVKGHTLQGILNDLRHEVPGAAKQYPLAHLLTIFRKVCDAMAFAHSRGIIHRDLKPENIMVGEFGEVLVMDWGLAKLLDTETRRPGDGEKQLSASLSLPTSVSSQTLDGSIMGTPQYMSPEQAEGRIVCLRCACSSPLGTWMHAAFGHSSRSVASSRCVRLWRGRRWMKSCKKLPPGTSRRSSVRNPPSAIRNQSSRPRSPR